MASLLANRAPRCLSCLRRAVESDTPSLFHPIKVQVRGKKRLPKSPTIPVRLLEDVVGYGRKGVIIPVAPARMRNIWYPKGQAAYMTLPEMKAAKENQLIEERDSSFGTRKDAEDNGPEYSEEDLRISLVAPQRSRDLIEMAVPEYLEFQRTPIFSKTAQAQPSVAIFGSVSTLDIATDIKALLAQASVEEGYAEASKVVINASDVHILNNGLVDSITEADKIKALGHFEVEIRLKGVEPVTKRIRVVEAQ